MGRGGDELGAEHSAKARRVGLVSGFGVGDIVRLRKGVGLS